MNVRVAICDDDPLVRAGLSMMLHGAHGITVVAEAADGDQIAAITDAHHPDVILMDIRMARLDGITATRRLRARPNPPEIIVLTTFDTDDNVLQALRAGASGFLLKSTPPGRIAEAVLKVAAGEPILSPQITRRLMQHSTDRHDIADRARAQLATLSPREYEVAAAVGQGHPNTVIAGDLHMSVATVKAHITRILDKLGLDNRTQIALIAHDAETRPRGQA